MEYGELMNKLEELGSEQTKNIYLNHGAKEPVFGVKTGDIKKFVKYVKKDHDLALKLYDSGVYEAMYLAGLSVNPKLMTKDMLQKWVKKASWYNLAEYTVAQVAAESNFALELAREWMRADEEMIAVAGWSTYSNYISITPNEDLDMDEIRSLLNQVRKTIHEERNRVRYVMNSFVISVGAYIPQLTDTAKKIGKAIGKVHVDVGNTACKVPIAVDYIEKVEVKNKIGKKRKTCIC